MLCLGHN